MIEYHEFTVGRDCLSVRKYDYVVRIKIHRELDYTSKIFKTYKLSKFTHNPQYLDLDIIYIHPDLDTMLSYTHMHENRIKNGIIYLQKSMNKI